MSDVTEKSNKRSNRGMDTRFLPDGLVHTRRAWTATYQALATAGPADYTLLRRRLLRLSVRLWWHPAGLGRKRA